MTLKPKPMDLPSYMLVLITTLMLLMVVRDLLRTPQLGTPPQQHPVRLAYNESISCPRLMLTMRWKI